MKPPSYTPPEWPFRLLRWFCDPQLLEDVEGDLLEMYHERTAGTGSKARRWLILQVMLLFRPGIIRSVIPVNKTQTTMISHYFKTAWRHSLRYKAHTMLNLFGLITGITAAILLLIWIHAEMSMDTFHEKSDRIVKVWRNMHQGTGEVNTTPAVPQPMEVVLENEYPEVDEVTLVSWEMELPVRHENHKSYYDSYFVSPEFLSVFSFPIIYGSKTGPLDDPSSTVITTNTARAIFGVEDVSGIPGKSIMINQDELYTISAIVDDPRPESSIQFDILLPAARYIENNEWVTSWYNGGFRMYLTLNDPADLHSLAEKVKDEVNKNTDYVADERIYLQPFTDTYLFSTFDNGLPVGGRMQYVRILGATAVFLLLIAGVNYTNLTTARSSRRAREVGLRKMFGARAGSISWQFYLESLLLIIIAVTVALALAVLLLPWFSQLASRELIISWDAPMTWWVLGGLIFGLTLISGFYPAIVMPAFQIIASLKNSKAGGGGSTGFRKVLVVFQFALSMLLIIGMLVVSGQLNFILGKNLGVNKDNRIVIPVDNLPEEQRTVFRDMAMNETSVGSIALSSANPLQTGWSTSSAEWDGKDPDMVAEINIMNIDEYFIETLGITIEKGRGFTGQPTDSSGYIINQVAADLMNYEDPVGENLSVWGTSGKIIGVVKNFHMSNLYTPIEPLIMRYEPESASVAIAYVPDAGEGLATLRELNAEIAPDIPFRYIFMDQDFASDYQSEQSVGLLMKIFAGLSIFVACLGLFGLISYTNEQRRQEIGIRKVMGASASGLVFLLSREYLVLLGIAFLVACPLAWYLTTDWLNNFAFHINVGAGVFLLAALILLVVGSLTTGIKSMISAQMNPAESIRNE